MSEISKRRIVDKRNKSKFFVDDYFLDKFSKIVGPACSVLYMWLCRHANEEGECFPGQEKLAENMGVDVRTIRRNLEILEKHNIISIVQMGLRKNNRYYLLDKSEWVEASIQTGQKCPVIDRTKMSSLDRTSDDTESDKNVRSRPDTIMSGPIVRVPVVNGSNEGVTDTNVSVQDEPAVVNPVNALFSILLEVNQTLNFGNKTERSAAQRIIDRLGEEKALASARAAVMASRSGEQFAPSITTPLELEKKMGKLVNFYKRTSISSQSYALQTTNPDL